MRRAVFRVAITTAARRAQIDRFALGHDVLGVGVDILAVDFYRTMLAVFAAVEPWGGDAGAFRHEERDDGAFGFRYELNLLAQSAAMFTIAAGSDGKAFKLTEQGTVAFGNFNGGGRNIAGPG